MNVQTIVEKFKVFKDSDKNSIALIMEGHHYTYGQLDDQANELAQLLQNRSLKSNDVIAVLMENSKEFIISILAILKIGGTYLPINVKEPVNRLKYMLKDSQAKCILINDKNENFELDEEIMVISLLEKIITTKKFEELDKYDPNSIAYINYSSGTTGNPKGIKISNKAVINLISNNSFPFNNNEVFTHTSNIAFDATTFEVWGSLLNGAKLLVLSDKTIIYEKIDEIIKKYSVTTMLLPTGLFNYLSDDSKNTFKGLKTLVVGGDILNYSHVNNLYKRNPDIKIINAYGPTENTTISTLFIVPRNNSNDIVPIGKAIDGVITRVLDEEGHDVSIGKIGELFLSGHSLSSGYIGNSSKLNKDMFVKIIGSKNIFYKTGDIVKVLEDGNLEFINRKDNQIKYRGYRVELSEIERVMLKNDKVSEAFVWVDKSVENDELCCNLVSNSLTEKELRNYLVDHLPVYMLPKNINFVVKMPLNSSGKYAKVNIKKINENKIFSSKSGTFEYIKDRLKVLFGNINEYENFYELGGTSLQALTLLTDINDYYNCNLTYEIFSKMNNFSDLYNFIRRNYESEMHSELSPLQTFKFPSQSNLKLTSAQSQMLFLNEISDRGTYNNYSVIRILGDLDLINLKNAINFVVENNELLKAKLIMNNGEIVLTEDLNVSEKISIQYLKENTSEEINKSLIEFINTPFDLYNDSYLRVLILKINNQHYLALTMPHFISDGLSLSIVSNEISEAYNNKQFSVIKDKETYFSYINWFEQYRNSKKFISDQIFWRNELLDIPNMSTISEDSSRNSHQTNKGNQVQFKLNSQITKKLNHFSKENNISMYSLFLATLKVLTYKYTSQNDLIIGTHISGRPKIHFNNTIGYFVNNLPIRTKNINDETNIKELCQRIQKTVFKVFDHKMYRFEDIVKHQNIQKDLSYNPIFQIAYLYQVGIEEKWALNGCEIYKEEFHNKTSKFDLTLIVNSIHEEANLSVEYNTDLYSKPYISNLINHYNLIIEYILEHVDDQIKNIDLRTEEEIFLINQSNHTDVKFKSNSLYNSIQEIATKFPNKIAISTENDSITYKDLIDKVDNLSSRLQNEFKFKKNLVAIYQTRSINLIISILALLKCKIAYLPVDTSIPLKRVESIIQDSEPDILLTDKFVKSLASLNLSNLYCIDDFDLETVKNPLFIHDKIRSNSTDDFIVYSIYTSGTTGTPKGIEISHEALNNHMQWMLSENFVNVNDKVLFKTNYSFDASIWEYFLPLISGAELVILNNKHQFNLKKIKEYIQSKNITTIQFVPSLLKEFLSGDSNYNFNSLKNVFCGGEILHSSLTEQFYNQYPDSNLINLYGPSEACIDSSYLRVEKKRYTTQSIPIGFPIKNVKLHVLDKNLNHLPINFVGELYISGKGLFNGYTNAPLLNSDKILIHPQIGRMYKTGDLVKRLHNGEILFIERIDSQSNINGNRIELAEIENLLLSHLYVDKSAVILKDKNIYAYVQVNADVFLSSTIKGLKKDFRKYLLDRLPLYMMPYEILLIDALPMKPNGKIDKHKLFEKSYGLKEKNENTNDAKNKNAITSYIYEYCNSSFPDNKINFNSNFFHIGGDSLKAMMMIESINRKFAIDVQIIDLYTYPILDELASFITNNEKWNIKGNSNADNYTDTNNEDFLKHLSKEDFLELENFFK